MIMIKQLYQSDGIILIYTGVSVGNYQGEGISVLVALL